MRDRHPPITADAKSCPLSPPQSQAALGGRPSTDASTMFVDGAFEDRPVLECTPHAEAKIRNHTCVLAPEVTQVSLWFQEKSSIKFHERERARTDAEFRDLPLQDSDVNDSFPPLS